jgi:hypothetical protein
MRRSTAFKEIDMQDLRWRRWGGAVAAGLTLCGCMGTSPFGGGAAGSGDPEPLYKVDNRSGGFTISTVHTRRKTPRDVVEQACRQGLVRNANDLARSLGRSVQPIEERSVRVRMSTDATTDVTRCEGSVQAVWAP